MADAQTWPPSLRERDALRRMLLRVLRVLTPSNWYDSVETCALLDACKPLLTARQRRALLEHLTSVE